MRHSLAVGCGLLSLALATCADDVECTQVGDCEAGYICVAGSCAHLCQTDSDCAAPRSICEKDICQAGSRPPVVDSVDSDGAPDPSPEHAGHYLNQHIILTGSFLDAATVRLTGGGRHGALEVCSSSDSRLVALLPPDIDSGEYTLHVSNGGGECSAPISLLQGAPGDPCATGVLYTRWGRKTCPAGADLVYAGILVGKASFVDQASFFGLGGSDPLCASPAASWLDYDSGNQDGNLVVGAEYKTGGYAVGAALTSLHDSQVPCAVCVVNDRSLMLMMPGSTACPSGWTQEYRGYLMGPHAVVSGETVCVDETPEASLFGGGTGSEGSYLLYLTEAECGSLPCEAGQYVQDREMTCAVCTR